jgi:hypothetical protein
LAPHRDILHGAALGLTPEPVCHPVEEYPWPLERLTPSSFNSKRQDGKNILLHRQKNPVMLVVFASVSRSDLLLQSAAGGSRIF